VLLAGILRYLGRDVVFLSFPDHLAVGIGEGGLLDQAVWTWQGRWYWYLETTGFGWEIGHVPDGRREAVIYPAG
jgi:hypothetical protein